MTYCYTIHVQRLKPILLNCIAAGCIAVQPPFNLSAFHYRQSIEGSNLSFPRISVARKIWYLYLEENINKIKFIYTKIVPSPWIGFRSTLINLLKQCDLWAPSLKEKKIISSITYLLHKTYAYDFFLVFTQFLGILSAHSVT